MVPQSRREISPCFICHCAFSFRLSFLMRLSILLEKVFSGDLCCTPANLSLDFPGAPIQFAMLSDSTFILILAYVILS